MLYLSFVHFLISLLVSFSSLSVIIYQQEEGIYLDGIVYSRIKRVGTSKQSGYGIGTLSGYGTGTP